MDPAEANKMTPTTSYPSPTAQPAAAYPLYGHQTPVDRDTQSHVPTAPMQSSDVDERHFTPNYGQPPLSTPQQLAQQGLNINHDGPQLDLESARKKQKVSRACDECRRKKIKCDAVEGDTTKLRCSACARSENTCQFSRAPQKRGPSKGYIKDLAERVQMLEHRNENPQQTPGFSYDLNAYSPSPDYMGSDPRKRTHSMTEGANAVTPGSEHIQNFGKGYTPNMTCSNPLIPDAAYAFPEGFDPLRNASNDMDGLSSSSFDEYYREMHIYFPILPDSKSEVNSILEGVQKPINDAFMAAVNAAIQISTSTPDARLLENASKLLNVLVTQDPKSRNKLENLIALQTCLFMILARESSGPGINESILTYGFAYAIAIHLNLHLHEGVEAQDAQDTVAVKTHGRRAWLVLIMLDRWHAASMVTPLSVLDDNVLLQSSDRKLLGEAAYNLIRISIVLGHAAQTLLPRDPKYNLSDDSPDPMIGRVIKGELERVREGIELSFPNFRHIQLAYLHAKLLSDRNFDTSTSNTKAIIVGALTIIHILPNEQNHASPLTNHFAALATLTLAEVIARDPAPVGIALQELQNDLNNGSIQSPYGVSGSRPAWSNTIARFISKCLDQQNLKSTGTGANASNSNGNSSGEPQRGALQDLADAAVGGTGTGVDGGAGGTEGGEAEGEGDDKDKTAKAIGEKLDAQGEIKWTVMTRAGYLKVFD